MIPVRKEGMILLFFPLLFIALLLFCACGRTVTVEPSPCPHEWTDDGLCRFCGEVCPHSWCDGSCILCSSTCPHIGWLDGRCITCLASCRHIWADGSCTVCDILCSHSEHAPDGLCLVCGEKVYHQYVENRCACGRELQLENYALPEPVASLDSPEKGARVSFSYTTHNYRFERDFNRESGVITKQCRVYLPYGYDEANKYDVLFLIHGYEQDERDWLDYGHYCRTVLGIRGADLADAMIYYGFCAPMILVSITTYDDFWEYEYGEYSKPEQLTPEFRNDILPAIVENFSTWSEGTEPEQLAAARDHFGIAGLSNGSLAAYYTGMMQCVDYFSWFGCFSGNYGSDGILEALNALPEGENPIHFHLATAGSYDSQYENMVDGYTALTEGTDHLTDGSNAAMVIVDDAGHDWTTWMLSLYNTMMVFFR